MIGYPMIRKLAPQEVSFLEEMLFEAIFIPDGAAKLSEEVIKQPELARYITDFGREGDLCW